MTTFNQNNSSEQTQNLFKKVADWEIDFYSRPILEADGKKRWELLISSSERFLKETPFRWEKKCSAGEVNSVWLSNALKEALLEAKKQGWEEPNRIRFWRPSMKTIIKRAAENLGLDAISSRRTYSLMDWIIQREKEFYPNQEGYIAGPLAPASSPIINQSIPLPEAIQGDALAFARITTEACRQANQWPMEFNGLIPIKESINQETFIPGIRLFSRNRSLALAAWLGSLEPVKLVIEGEQLVLEAGQDERWLVTDLDKKTAAFAKEQFELSIKKADGLQFISVQATPEEQKFTGFWMLKDLIEN